MVKLFLFKLWPALLPILLFLIYTLIRPAKGDAVIEAKRTKHWPYVLLLSIIICATILLYSAITASNHGDGYQPTRLENGKLINESLTP